MFLPLERGIQNVTLLLSTTDELSVPASLRPIRKVLVYGLLLVSLFALCSFGFCQGAIQHAPPQLEVYLSRHPWLLIGRWLESFEALRDRVPLPPLRLVGFVVVPTALFWLAVAFVGGVVGTARNSVALLRGDVAGSTPREKRQQRKFFEMKEHDQDQVLWFWSNAALIAWGIGLVADMLVLIGLALAWLQSAFTYAGWMPRQFNIIQSLARRLGDEAVLWHARIVLEPLGVYFWATIVVYPMLAWIVFRRSESSRGLGGLIFVIALLIMTMNMAALGYEFGAEYMSFPVVELSEGLDVRGHGLLLRDSDRVVLYSLDSGVIVEKPRDCIVFRGVMTIDRLDQPKL